MDAGATVRPAVDDNQRIPSGYTFFGELLVHDVSFDRRPPAVRGPAENGRSARLDLDSLYGAGPVAAPYLYDRTDPAKLLLVPRLDAVDVQRNAQGTAVIPDPRNDVNLVVVQLHVALARAHNRLVDELRDRVTAPELFSAARDALVAHVQWLLLFDYLPRILGDEVARRISAARTPGRDWMPLEATVAALRFGHSQVRPSYALSGSELVPLFAPRGEAHLGGGRVIARGLVVDWSRFFRVAGAAPPLASLRIDTRITAALLDLPDSVAGPLASAAERSIAVRNLARAEAVGLPSGEDVARALGEQPLAPDELWPAGLEELRGSSSPLWWYVLREAELRHRGEQLGAVGAALVGDAWLAVLDGDPRSIRNRPAFRPSLGASPERFEVIDLLTYAGVVRG
jgi:hypothetical protein